MAVPCQSCGREYDVALFAFGRTIGCTCGSRVGLDPRVHDRFSHCPACGRVYWEGTHTARIRRVVEQLAP